MRMLRAVSRLRLIAAARLVLALLAGIPIPGATAQSGSHDFVIRQVRVFDGVPAQASAADLNDRTVCHVDW